MMMIIIIIIIITTAMILALLTYICAHLNELLKICKKNAKSHLNITATFRLSELNFFCAIRGSRRAAAEDSRVGSTPCRLGQ